MKMTEVFSEIERHRGPQSKAGEWRYENFGPFVFDRRGYEQALISGEPVT